MADLNGKVAVVLGASAAKGTGWAIAEALAAHGAKVVVGARSYDPLRVLADRIGGTALKCDAANEADISALAECAISTYGRLNIAVNSAGMADFGLVAGAEEANLRKTTEVNYYGNVYFVKHMAKAIGSDGSVTVISSLAATHPMLPLFSYACAKAATDCLVRYAALEYGPQNIRINSIQPGPIMSEMTGHLYAQPEYHSALIKEIPLARIGYPRDYADAVLWLAGSAYVTGLNLPVCGGMQLARFPYREELPGMGPRAATPDPQRGVPG